MDEGLNWPAVAILVTVLVNAAGFAVGWGVLKANMASLSRRQDELERKMDAIALIPSLSARVTELEKEKEVVTELRIAAAEIRVAVESLQVQNRLWVATMETLAKSRSTTRPRVKGTG